MDAFIQELIIMWRLRDMPNIAQFYGYAENPSTILMAYYPGGALFDFIHNIKKGPLPSDMTERIALGLSLAIQAVHALGFAHCDLKVRIFPIMDWLFQTNNILLKTDSDGTLAPVLTDFGIAKMHSGRSVSVAAFKPANILAASFAYAAPEVLFALTANQEALAYLYREDILLKSDIYSIAMIIYEMLSGTIPWEDVDKGVIITKVVSDERPEIFDYDETDECAKRLILIMKRCWRENPLHRPTAAELVESLSESNI
jgi:serine/threonine protein kinase